MWNRADLIGIFKMVKGFSAVPWSPFSTRATGSITKKAKGTAGSWRRKFSHVIYPCMSSQRSVNRWKRLTQEEVVNNHWTLSKIPWSNADMIRWTSFGCCTSCCELQTNDYIDSSITYPECSRSLVSAPSEFPSPTRKSEPTAPSQ